MRVMLALTLMAMMTLFLPPAEAQQPAGSLTLKNPRLVYSMFGQERKEAKLLLGDIFWLAYDIEGLQTREDGKVLYSIGMELTSKEGKSIFKQAPKDLEAVNSLGGGRKPAFAFLEIGTETPPGEYTATLTVTDRLAKKSEVLTSKFEVLAQRFGFVLVGLTQPDYRPTPPIAVPGQDFWVHFALTGFALNDKKQPDVSIDLQVYDLSTNKAVLPKSVTGQIKEVDKEEFKKFIPWTHQLSLNRPGKFRVQVTATDNNSKKTAGLELDFTVLDVK